MRKCFVMLAVSVLLCSSAFGAVWYVDKDNLSGVENGQTWQTAFTTIQPAIHAAASAGGGEVWVAEGVYDEQRVSLMHVPEQDTGSLMLAAEVRLYGGFVGFETARNERNAAAHETVIEGRAVHGRAPAKHVVVGADDALLDGFTITGGNANGVGDAGNGAGLFNEGVSPTVKNCKFVGNWASGWGGALFNTNQAAPTITQCAFDQNWAHEGGAGAASADHAAPTITKCSFTGNTAVQKGGALLNTSRSAAVVRESTFDANTAEWGGAVCTFDNATPALIDCTFTYNEANRGAALYTDSCPIKVTSCAFTYNAAGNNGGAAYNRGSAQSTFAACTFNRNEAWDNGGALYNTDMAAPLIVNCVFVANLAGRNGGALYNAFCTPRLTNCTIAYNNVERQTWHDQSGWAKAAGGILNDEATPTIANCIVWGNYPNAILSAQDETKPGAIIRYSDIQGGCLGEGNINLAPAFVNPLAGDYRLMKTSPCIDAGDATAAPTTDLLDVQRPQGAAPDMGAYEYNATPLGQGLACYAGPITPSAPSRHIGDLALLALAAITVVASTRRFGRATA
ncbi:MAG TPA: DUF1565 domain-containing protein [Candidatus Hydrogenedentes bacterium]|nr:DUF1565 domain-containing protein [Candidatus Hydrogenedentota bacterium]